MSRFLATLALLSLFILNGCSEPLTIVPEPEAISVNPMPRGTPHSDLPSATGGEQSASPTEMSRFFCEHGAVYDSILTFTSRATEEALGSRIYFNDPARPESLLKEIRFPKVMKADTKTARLVLQATSLSGRIGEPGRRVGIYLAEIDLIARTAQARLLANTPVPSGDLKRLASQAGLRLSFFGTETAANSRVLLPSADGYLLVRPAAVSDESTADEVLGFIPCPPTQCWNPEIVTQDNMEEIWFSAFNDDTGNFLIRAFREPAQEASSMPTIYEAVLFPSRTVTSKQVRSVHRGTAASWLEETSQAFFLGTKDHESGTYFELPPSVRGYLPKSMTLASWNGITDVTVVATPTEQGHEQIWVLGLDRGSARAVAQREVAIPPSSRLTQFVAAEPGALYATFQFGKSAGTTKLMRYSPQSQLWETLARRSCENPSVGSFYE